LRNNSELFNAKKKVTKRIPSNFAKFLVNPQGTVVKYFDPIDDLEEVQKEIEKLL
jgi:glutathione peroxidase-family protein